MHTGENMKTLEKLFLFFVIGIFLVGIVYAGGLFGNNQKEDSNSEDSGGASVNYDASANSGGDSKGQSADYDASKNTGGDKKELFGQTPEEIKVDLDKIEWKVNPPVWHSAEDIKIKVGEGYYSLQEAIDKKLISLPRGEIASGVLYEFAIPQNIQWYNNFCSGGNSEEGKYIELKNSFNVNNQFIREGEIYDFTCETSDGDESYNARIELKKDYQVLFVVEKPKRVDNDFFTNANKYGENEKFAYLVSYENGNMKFRISRPGSCGTNLDSVTDNSNCDSSSGGLGGIGNILRGTCKLPNCPIGHYNSCTGIYCYCDSITYPNCVGPLHRDYQPPFSECDGEDVNIATTECSQNQCPLYTVKGGVFTFFKDFDVYNWDGLKCEIRAV